MENTLENKVRFFALYWGQKVFVNPMLSVEPVSNIYVFDIAEPDDLEQDFFPIRNWGIVEWVFNYCGWSVTRRETVEMDEFDFSACEVIGNRIDDHELIKTE